MKETFSIAYLHKIVKDIILPGNMWGLHLIPLKKIALIVDINDQLKTDKTVVFTDSCLPIVVIIDKQIEVNEIKSENDLQL